jgi:hypothetical protein
LSELNQLNFSGIFVVWDRFLAPDPSKAKEKLLEFIVYIRYTIKEFLPK